MSAREPKAGDVIRVKTEAPQLIPLRVTVLGRSGSYPGWNVRLPDGLGGIVLDREIAGIDGEGGR
jgi:hypothetical protein